MSVPRPLPPCGRGVCVSTQAPGTDPLRRIEPLRFEAEAEVVMRALLGVLGRVPRLRMLERDDVSVHAIVRSAWLRVPTDLEVRVDAVVGHVHLRAATPFALRERSHSRVRADELLRAFDRAIRTA